MNPAEPLKLISLADLGVIGPILVLTIWALGVMVADLFLDIDRKNWLPWFAAIGVAVAFLELRLIGGLLTEKTTVILAFYDCLRLDRIVLMADSAILAGTLFLLLLSPQFLKGRAIPLGEYYALILFAAVAMMALAASNELLTLFVNIELLSITLYALAGIERSNLRSTEAAFKYFLTGSYAAAFLLFGITLLYGATGTTAFAEIAVKAGAGDFAQPVFAAAGIALMLVGFGFKLTLAPFHMYAPDLYAGAPTPIAAFIATGSKVAGWAAFLSFFRTFVVWDALPASIYHLFLALAVLSIVVGNVGALTQPNIKRLLAYSGVAHAGYTLIPFTALLWLAHTGSPLRSELLPKAESAIGYYLLAYTLMTLAAFGVAATLGVQGDSHLDRYAGLARRSPALATVLALALISLTGVPLTVGFLGKFYLFSIAVNAQLYVLAAFGVLASVASAYYYLRVIVRMFMEEPKGGKAADPVGHIEMANGAALFACSMAIFLFAVFPMIFLE